MSRRAAICATNRRRAATCANRRRAAVCSPAAICDGFPGSTPAQWVVTISGLLFCGCGYYRRYPDDPGVGARRELRLISGMFDGTYPLTQRPNAPCYWDGIFPVANSEYWFGANGDFPCDNGPEPHDAVYVTLSFLADTDRLRVEIGVQTVLIARFNLFGYAGGSANLPPQFAACSEGAGGVRSTMVCGGACLAVPQ